MWWGCVWPLVWTVWAGHHSALVLVIRKGDYITT
jgi:hypothetical protein